MSAVEAEAQAGVADAAGAGELVRELLRFVAEEVALDGRGLSAEERFIETGRIDSLGLVQLLAFVASRYGVDLSTAGDPRDLESIAALAAAIQRRR